MGHALRKRVFLYMLTAKALISLRIRAVWPEPSLSANRSIGHYRMFNGEQMPGWDFAHVPDDVNLHILRMLESTFSLDATHITRLFSQKKKKKKKQQVLLIIVYHK